MVRLTTDAPEGNFQTMLNFVYGKDGWAHIRYAGDREDVPLTEWARRQCLLRGCDEFPEMAPQEIDAEISGCMMDCPGCPIALAYCFASQAVHLRSRLKLYEDILFDGTGSERLTLDALRRLVEPNAPLTLEELREMDGEPVWICDPDGSYGIWALVDLEYELCRTAKGGIAIFDTYSKTWLAYRRKPERVEAP